MKIKLTKKEIASVFESRKKEKWLKLIAAYDFLQEHLCDAHDAEIFPQYSRTFNYFYQVRRNAAWRKKFYDIFFKHGAASEVNFELILRELHEKTGQMEISFSSKLAATLDPELPVIDRHVLSYLGQKLPQGKRDPELRIGAAIELHKKMRQEFQEFLDGTSEGEYLIERFKVEYPEAKISKMKMLDFVLWQSGGKKPARP